MPYNDPELRKFIDRQVKRRLKHGPDFRQVYVDNDGMCQGILDDGMICGAVEALEFHEMFKENTDNNLKKTNGQSKFNIRTMLCFDCHKNIKLSDHYFSHRKWVSRLAEDMALEMTMDGGREAWMKKRGTVDRSQPQTVRIEGKERVEPVDEEL